MKNPWINNDFFFPFILLCPKKKMKTSQGLTYSGIKNKLIGVLVFGEQTSKCFLKQGL